MEKHWLDYAMAAVQILSLVALIIYVWKTWTIAKISVDSFKTAEKPYVVAYFDKPNGKPWIYLIVKNLGKSVAKNVKLTFNPPLESHKEFKLKCPSVIKYDIPVMPPQYEIRTIINKGEEIFNKTKNYTLLYKVKIEYSGGVTDENQSFNYELDLDIFRPLLSINDEGPVVEEMKNIVKTLKDLKKTLKERNIIKNRISTTKIKKLQ